MRELRFILFCICTLTLTGIFIVSCASTGPTSHIPDQRAERDPYLPPRPPKPVQRTAPMPPAVVARSVSLPTNRQPSRLPIAWDAVPNASGYYLYFSRGNQQWTRLDVGTNSVVNLTNFSIPMEFQVTAYNSARMEGPPSSEAYYGAKSNGWVFGGNFSFIAQPGGVYTLSNAPLAQNRWTFWQAISNRSGLVTVPLTNQEGRVGFQAER